MLPSGRFPLHEEEDMNKLGATFTGKEVKDAIFEMGAYTAQGPDGFQALFIKNFGTLCNSPAPFPLVILSDLGHQPSQF